MAILSEKLSRSGRSRSRQAITDTLDLTPLLNAIAQATIGKQM